MLMEIGRSWDVVYELSTQLSFKILPDESNPSLRGQKSISIEESENGDDYGVVHLGTNVPYRDEPLTFPGQAAQAYGYEEDVDNIPLVTITAWFERRWLKFIVALAFN